MLPNELKRYFPNAGQAFLALNTDNPQETTKLERNSRPEPLATGQVQERSSQRFLVRVTSIRKRLLDEDNLCEKYHVDLCRYAGMLPGDEAGTTKIETTQRKALKAEEEQTIIEIFSL
jgi:hypothetical protein